MMKIGSKLGVGIGTLLALCVVIGIVSYTQTQRVRKKLEEVTRVKEPTNIAVYEIENNLVETAFATLGYFATGDPKLAEGLEKNRQSFNSNRQRYADVIAAGNAAGAETGIQEKFVHLYELGAGQIVYRDQSAAKMRELLAALHAVDRLLTQRIQKSISVDDPLAYKRLQAALEMQVQVNAIMKGISSYLLTGESQYVDQFLAAEREFRKFYKVYQIVLISSQEKAWSAELSNRFTQSLALAGSIVDLQKERGEHLTAFMLAYRELGAIISDQLKAQTEENLASAKEDLLDAGQAANSRILAVLLVGVLFGIVAGVVTTRQITRPLLHLVSVMNAVAKGDRLKKVELTSSDEFRQLGESFNQMIGQLAEAEGERLASVRAFAASVQRAQEEERRRISRELHDDLCQRLSGMKFRVEVMEDDVRPLSKRMTKQLRDFAAELDHSIVEVRRISSNLRPSVLDDFGLVTALRILAKEFQAQHGANVMLDLQENVPVHFEGDLEIALYRIAQEALANIGRYAGASAVMLFLGSTGTKLTMRIQDNGKGFTPDDVAVAREAGHGAGLMGMRERTELLGGVFDLQTGANAGTTITVTLSFHGEKRHGEN
jgi:signal transduction histidine kinase